MKAKRKTTEEGAAFVMEAGDRFHAIIASNGIRYGQAPDTETVLVFFAIRRASGLIDIFNVMKTFKDKTCISRNVQSKLGIPETRMTAELEAIREHFSRGIRDATGFAISWNELDLSAVSNRDEQIRRMRQWNRINVFKLPEIGLN